MAGGHFARRQLVQPLGDSELLGVGSGGPGIQCHQDFYVLLLVALPVDPQHEQRIARLDTREHLALQDTHHLFALIRVGARYVDEYAQCLVVTPALAAAREHCGQASDPEGASEIPSNHAHARLPPRALASSGAVMSFNRGPRRPFEAPSSFMPCTHSSTRSGTLM